jgi:hypothetical protein
MKLRHLAAQIALTVVGVVMVAPVVFDLWRKARG